MEARVRPRQAFDCRRKGKRLVMLELNPSKTRPSALQHGAWAETAILPGEDPRQFERLHRGLIKEWSPCGPAEQDAVLTLEGTRARGAARPHDRSGAETPGPDEGHEGSDGVQTECGANARAPHEAGSPDRRPVDRTGRLSRGSQRKSQAGRATASNAAFAATIGMQTCSRTRCRHDCHI